MQVVGRFLDGALVVPVNGGVFSIGIGQHLQLLLVSFAQLEVDYTDRISQHS